MNPALQQAVLKRCAIEPRTKRLIVSLGNSRLDFTKDYFVKGFTNKTIKISYQNGSEEINVQARIRVYKEHYWVYTEGGSFSMRIPTSELTTTQGGK